MRTTIRMNNALASEAKRFAVTTGQTFTDVIEQAVTELLARHRAGVKRRKRVSLPTFGNPGKKISWEQYQRAVEEAEQVDDLRGLGLKRDDAA